LTKALKSSTDTLNDSPPIKNLFSGLSSCFLLRLSFFLNYGFSSSSSESSFFLDFFSTDFFFATGFSSSDESLSESFAFLAGFLSFLLFLRQVLHLLMSQIQILLLLLFLYCPDFNNKILTTKQLKRQNELTNRNNIIIHHSGRISFNRLWFLYRYEYP